MTKIINSAKIELLIMHRNYWSYFILISSLLYFGSSSLDLVQSHQPGESLNGTAYIIQACIFLFITYGIFLVKEEFSNESDEVFATIPNGLREKYIGKLIHIVMTVLFFCFLHLVLLFIIFFINQIPADFYYPSFLFFILYWFIPFIISGIVGLIIGICIKSKMAFPIMLIIGMFIGPLNQIVFVALAKMLPVWLQKLMFLMNLGQSDPFRAYHIVYGFPMEHFRWLSKLGLLLSVICIFVALLSQINKFKYWKIIMFAVTLITVGASLGSWRAMSPHLEELTSRQAIKSDNSFYLNKTIKSYQEGTEFRVSKYDMDVTVKNGLKNKVRMQIEPDVNMDKLIFSLYHNFKVHSVKLFDEEMPFIQEIDYLTVSLPSALLVSKKYNIEIIYSGSGPQRFFSNQQAVMLPGFLPWYPVPGKQPVAEFIDKYMAVFYSYKPENTFEVNMRYTGPDPLYTNLEYDAREGVWKAYDASGITLVSGEMEELYVNNIKVVRPYALYGMSKDMTADINVFVDLYKDISQRLAYQYKPLNKIFLIETRLNDENFWFEENYAIIDVSILLNSNNFFQREFLIRQIVEGLVRNYHWEKQDRTMRELFVRSYSYWYEQIKFGLDKNQNNLLKKYSSVVQDYYPNHLATYNQLLEFLDDNINDEKMMSQFFNEWIQCLKSEEKINWDHLDQIIAKTSKGEGLE
ncbi:hypothetical protein ACFW1P_16460 [Paenibacillus sp. NPDC058910]|uniref:ABC transporter permease n=1 Tax=unclassified Paenibacillus TaxID=185978 RepID=UPI0036C92B10